MVFAGINALCGVGILSVPYALKEGGWAALSILLIFSVFSFYTGLLLRYCLDSQPGLETYPDIGQAAFGTYGRVVISVSPFYIFLFSIIVNLKPLFLMSYLPFYFSFFFCMIQVILYMELYVSVTSHSL